MGEEDLLAVGQKGGVASFTIGRLLDLSRRTPDRAFARPLRKPWGPVRRSSGRAFALPLRGPADLSAEARAIRWLHCIAYAAADRDLDLRKHVVLGSS